MRSFYSGLVTVLAVLLASCAQDKTQAAAGPTLAKLNVLLVVVDDMGFSDLGAFGGEISTPNLDRLASSGARLADFHTAATCSPTRSMLMTGVDHHLVGLGTMGETLKPGAPVRPGYEGYLNDRARTIAEIFKLAGYRTMMAGKWHLGKGAGQTPDARGFDRSYTLLDGAGNHFGAAQSGTVDSKMGEHYLEDGKKPGYPLGTYTADFFTDRILDYVGEAQSRKQPFFAYLAFTEPHWPLQAPPELIAKYRGRYDSGPAAVRAERLKRLLELGLFDPAHRPHEMIATREWSAMPTAERLKSARAMEIYAAMVERVDYNIGRVVARLQETGQLRNTIIVFLSDNGPDGSSADAVLRLLAARPQPPAPLDDLDNMGTAKSFVAYGQEWAQAGSAPFNRVKGYTTEGGLRVAAFVAGPGVKGHRIVHAFLHVTDVLPTLLEMTGTPLPSDGSKLTPSGKSFASVLAGTTAEIHQDAFVGWELFFGRAMRQNDWKAVWLLPSSPLMPLGGSGQWALYDLSKDSGETTDLSAANPEKLKALTDAWGAYAAQNGVLIEPQQQQN